jgi:hypothetical protein
VPTPRAPANTVSVRTQWATAEFGSAKLGDERLVKRAILIASSLAAYVVGTIVGTFSTEAQREAAYKFLGNVKVTVSALAMAAWRTCAQRCSEESWVYVAVDGSSISLPDPHRTRGTGPVGSHNHKGRGFIVMTAIAISSRGVALGVCGQKFWSRADRKIKHDRARRPFEKKESFNWVEVARQTMTNFVAHGGKCVPWFLFDRGGDIGDVLTIAVNANWRITVRATHNRRTQEGGEHRLLRAKLLSQPENGFYDLAVPEGKKRTKRVARMSVRASKVTFVLTHSWTGKKRTVTLNAVLAREVGTTPPGEACIEWLLLTTVAVNNFADAKLVIDGYAQRWKIELFHNLWKSGRCNIEQSRLHTADRIQKWATLLASVAVRTLRLTYLARTEPETPSDVEFSRDEIDAIILVREPKDYALGDTPPLGILVRWIAEYGGLTNKSKKIPPGKLVIARGLNRLASIVEVMPRLRSAWKKALHKK